MSVTKQLGLFFVRLNYLWCSVQSLSLSVINFTIKRRDFYGYRTRGTALNEIKSIGCTHAGHLDKEPYYHSSHDRICFIFYVLLLSSVNNVFDSIVQLDIFSDRASLIDYILITNLMHSLLFIHKILFSSTCFEPQVLIFRRIQLYTCSIWYHMLHVYNCILLKMST